MKSLKQRIITKAELVSMSRADFFILQLAIATKAWGFLGIKYKNFVRIHEDKVSGNIILEWQ